MNSICESQSLEVESEASSFDPCVENKGERAVSLYEVRERMGSIMPELLDRSMREPAFRESLLSDTRITIESLMSSSEGRSVRLPDFLAIKVFEDSDAVVNLVIPQGESLRNVSEAMQPGFLVPMARAFTVN